MPPLPLGVELLYHMLNQENIDIITVTSASSASNLVKNCHDPEILERLKSLPTACIGPITAKAATTAGLNVKVIAEDYTSEGLLSALKRYQVDKTNSH